MRVIMKAFPMDTERYSSEDRIFNEGMDMRDYFAAAVLQGVLANPKGTGTIEDIAIYAYDLADAMMLYREK